MEKLEEGIGDSVRPKNKFESHGESIQDSNKLRERNVEQFQIKMAIKYHKQ